jgi:diketogulonate reductase-like aldo/keto reductase
LPQLELQNGVKMPMIGFGTASFYDGIRRPELAYRALTVALGAGYRHIDSAVMYGSERQVGHVLGKHFSEDRLTREDIFITTKVGHPPTTDFPNAKTQYLYAEDVSAYDGVLQEFYQSLDDLGVGYVDLLLLHWPGLFEDPSRFGPDWNTPMPSKEVARKKRAEMWAAAEFIYERKLARAIGVSNYMLDHLEHLLPHCKVAPMMNQFEVHPYLPQEEMVAFCQSKGIQVTAYSPLGGGSVRFLEDPIVTGLAEKKKMTPAQIVLSWLMQRGIVVIPKSTNLVRMTQNLQTQQDVLSEEEMKLVSSLACGKRNCADPGLID